MPNQKEENLDIYMSLAGEMMEVLDQRKREMPHDAISAAVRGEMAVLRLLAEEDRALSAGEISRLLRMTTSRVAAVLGALDKKALIVRDTDAQDRRRVQVTLTQAGRTICARKQQTALKHMRYALSQLGEQDAKDFVRLMKRMNDILPPAPPMCMDEEDENEPKEEKHER